MKAPLDPGEKRASVSRAALGNTTSKKLKTAMLNSRVGDFLYRVVAYCAVSLVLCYYNH